MPRFGEMVSRDAQYKSDMKRILNNLTVTFFVSFFGITSILIASKYGNIAAEIVVGILPEEIGRQIQLLKEVDGRSHVAYVVTLPLMLVVGSIYGVRYLSATRKFLERAIALGSMPTLSSNATLLAALLTVTGAFLLLFSGTIAGSKSGRRDGDMLLWPFSGLIAYGVMVFAILCAVGIYTMVFRVSRSKP